MPLEVSNIIVIFGTWAETLVLVKANTVPLKAEKQLT